MARTAWRVTVGLFAVAILSVGCTSPDAENASNVTSTSTPSPTAGPTATATQPTDGGNGGTTEGSRDGSSDQTAESRSTPPPPEDFPTDPPPSEPVRSNGGAATGLQARPDCDPDDPSQPIVHLAWQPGGGGEQKVALTTRKDGFDTGQYWTTETLREDRSAYTVRDVQPGGRYYWRVLTGNDGSWAASATADFHGPTCVEDSPG